MNYEIKIKQDKGVEMTGVGAILHRSVRDV